MTLRWRNLNLRPPLTSDPNWLMMRTEQGPDSLDWDSDPGPDFMEKNKKNKTN